MSKLLNVSSSPHVRSHETTHSIMLDVAIAMLPATAFGVYHFGMHALLVLIVTVAACVLSEYVYEKLMKKQSTISDCSALVTGMILALNMPPEIPVWIPALGGIFAIIVVKQLYGGLGQNFMNPALAARCFLLISFAGKMTNFSYSGFDGVSGATPWQCLKAVVPWMFRPCLWEISRAPSERFPDCPFNRRSLSSGKEGNLHPDSRHLHTDGCGICHSVWRSWI